MFGKSSMILASGGAAPDIGAIVALVPSDAGVHAYSQKLEISPDGLHLYGNDYTGASKVMPHYSRDALSGLASFVANTTAVGFPLMCRCHPTQPRLYQNQVDPTNNAGNSVRVFNRNGAGALTFSTTFFWSSVPSLPAVGAAVTNDGSRYIAQFAGTGGLNALNLAANGYPTTQLASLGFGLSGTTFNSNPVMSPDDAFIYCANGTYLRVVANGASALSIAQSINVGEVITSPVITPDGNYVYAVATVSNRIYGWSRNPTTGVLTALSPAYIATPLTSGVIYKIQMAPDGLNLYALPFNGSHAGKILCYSIGSSGKLKQLSPANFMITTGGLVSMLDMVVSPDGLNVYASNASSIFQAARILPA